MRPLFTLFPQLGSARLHGKNTASAAAYPVLSRLLLLAVWAVAYVLLFVFVVSATIQIRDFSAGVSDVSYSMGAVPPAAPFLAEGK